MVRLLLEFGADMEAVDRCGRRPLHFAAQHGRLDVARVLLQSGVEKNALDFAGRTAAELATQFGHPGVSQFLQDDKRRRLS